MRTSRPVASALATLVLFTACGAEAARTFPRPSPPPGPSEVEPEPASLFQEAGAISTVMPTAVRPEPSSDAPPYAVLREGIVLPVVGRQAPFLRVLTPCEVEGWVHGSEVDLHRSDPERPTVVIDPGHGGQLPGAVGPTGLTEAAANLAISRRLVGKLDGVQALLTVTGDYTAGLRFRTSIANEMRADLFISVHNNADPDGPSERPGTETYYQIASPESRRLAGLLYEELVRSLDPLDIAWVSDDDAGAKYRTNSRGEDYYAILRMTQVPAVLVEAAFIANEPEEALLRTEAGQELIAESIASGIQRYLGTDDPGSGFVTPYPRPPGPSGRLPSVCTEPV